jgi:hypothetical protein
LRKNVFALSETNYSDECSTPHQRRRVFNHACGCCFRARGRLSVVSRAFVKEDSNVPEIKRAAYRLYAGRSRYDFDPVMVDSSDDLVLALRSLKNSQGYTQLRDASGTLLLEVM